MTELVHLHTANAVATVTLDSQANRNALSSQLLTELDDRLAAAIGDDAVRVIVLTAAGTVFCSGADLKEQLSANQAGRLSGPGGLVPILERMWHSPKPIVGRINGAARAGGLGLVAACDIAVAAEGATFGVSEVRIGVIPAIISVVLLPKLGATKCMELFLTAEPIDAAEAARIGLVTASAPVDQLDGATAHYVEAILKGAPGALAGAKQLVREVQALPMDEALEAMVQRSAAFFASDEAREGMAAFGEKRPPRWQRTQ